MRKQRHETDNAAELERSYARWNEVYTNGGSDPFWPDGVSLNLIRNHIIFYKEQLSKQENSLFGLPDAYYLDIPPEIDCDYMARPDAIREDARKAMEIIDADENLKYIREQTPNLSEQQKKQWCIPAVVNYADNLRRAINEDDLVIMRRYANPARYLESFESAAMKIRDPESTRPINGNLTACPFENNGEYEDGEDIYDDECSETEQDEDEDLSEPESEPEEDLQLRLF